MKADTPSRTAAGIAGARARESARPESERLFYDPYAQHFLHRRFNFIYRIPWLLTFLRWRNRRILPGMFGGLVVRTRYIDDFFLDSLQEGTKQVVILGAGYDARAYRFADACRGARIFEIDTPATQQIKKDVLHRLLGGIPDHVCHVPVRFSVENWGERLLACGYRPERKTLFIWEGVTMYLSAEMVDATLAIIAGQSASGSAVIFDYFPLSAADGTCPYKEARTLRKMVAGYGEPIRFGIDPETIVSFLAERSFHRIRNISAGECSKRYLRSDDAELLVSRLFHFASAEVP